MSDDYASAKKAYLHPSKLHVSKNSNMSYDKALLKGFKPPLWLKYMHRSGEIYTFKQKSERKIFFHPKSNFTKEYLEFPTRIKELPVRIYILI